ncbi:hypothetical protein V8C44DRAFT_47450 [Trichoderma aethiopicum]
MHAGGLFLLLAAGWNCRTVLATRAVDIRGCLETDTDGAFHPQVYIMEQQFGVCTDRVRLTEFDDMFIGRLV